MNPDSGLNRACKTLPNPTEPHGTPERPQTTVCAAVARPLRPSRGAAEMTGRCEERGLREAAEPTSLRHGKRSVAEACASKEPRPGAVESWSRARRRQAARAHAGCREQPLRSAAEWTGREPMSSRPTAWCRAALEPRRSARTPSGRRPSQPPARGLNRTSSGPLARLRTARAAGCGGGRSAGLGESAAMRNAVGADLRTVAGRRSAGGFRIYSNCLPKRGLQNTSGMHAHALASA